MKKLFASRVFLGALIVVALVAGVAIGGAFFARSVSDNGDAAAVAGETEDSSSTSSTVAPDDATTPDGIARKGASGSEAEAPDVSIDPAALRIVEPVGGPPPYSYQEPENSPVPLPPTLPVEVSLSSTQNLRPGDPINIRVVPTSGSETFGFRARLCKQDANLAGLYDFIPEVAPNCIAKPLSSDSDAYVEVKGEPPYQVAEGSFRVALGTDTFEMDDGTQASVACTKASPCQLVLQVHVPYGFGYFRYDLSFA